MRGWASSAESSRNSAVLSGIATPSSPTSSRRATLSCQRSKRSVSASTCVALLRQAVGAAQHRPHPRQQLARVERLHDVVVGAHLEADHPVGVLGHRGQHDHRHLGGRAQVAAERQPVLARHHDVEHHEIDRAALEELARARRGLGAADAEAVPGEIASRADRGSRGGRRPPGCARTGPSSRRLLRAGRREYAAVLQRRAAQNCNRDVSRPAAVTLADTLALAVTNLCDVYSLHIAAIGNDSTNEVRR